MRRSAAAVALALAFACASGNEDLRIAKDLYNRGRFKAARGAAVRAATQGGDPQAYLIAARASTRALPPPPPVDTAVLTSAARHLRAASRSWPFEEEWADREFAIGIGDWLYHARLPELARIYYRAALEAPGREPGGAELATAENLAQAELEAIDRWGPRTAEERQALREVERPVVALLERSGWPYPPGLADQAARLAWHRGDYRAAWEFAAAGWLRAIAEGDSAAAATLNIRVHEQIVPDWRASGDSLAVRDVIESWERARQAWRGEGS